MSPDSIRREALRQHPDRELVPRGDVALTRALLARGALRVVTERRGRLEQVGVAATRAMLDAARAVGARTAATRAVARERSRERREREEVRYVAAFRAAVRRLFPSIPDPDREAIVARACEVGSGRVGRCAAAKDLDDEPVRLAVRAHIRHEHTDYDALLDRAGAGKPFGRAGRDAKREVRAQVRARIDEVAATWARPAPVPAPAPVPLPASEDEHEHAQGSKSPPPAPRPAPAPKPSTGTSTSTSTSASTSPAPLWSRGLARR